VFLGCRNHPSLILTLPAHRRIGHFVSDASYPMDEPELLDRLIRRMTLDLIVETAAIRLRIAAHAFMDACRKAGFSPSQPRVPAGNPDGGQWADGGSDNSTLSDRIRIAEDRDPGFYSVDLEQEDRLRGGHGYRKHVGRSDLSLMAELVAGDHSTSFDARAGTFLSAGDANFFVTKVLRGTSRSG